MPIPAPKESRVPVTMRWIIDTFTVDGRSDLVVIDTDAGEGWSQYVCLCNEKHNYQCDHIQRVIEQRLDASFYENLIENETRRIVLLPVVFNPKVTLPFVVQGDGVTLQVAFPGFDGKQHELISGNKNLEEHELTTLMAGEGGFAILESLKDAFSAHHVENTKKAATSPGVLYPCNSRAHDMSANDRMLKRLKDSELKGNEMLRLALSGKCTYCADQELQKPRFSAGEAFGDLVPDLNPKPGIVRHKPLERMAVWEAENPSKIEYEYEYDGTEYVKVRLIAEAEVGDPIYMFDYKSVKEVTGIGDRERKFYYKTHTGSGVISVDTHGKITSIVAGELVSGWQMSKTWAEALSKGIKGISGMGSSVDEINEAIIEGLAEFRKGRNSDDDIPF